MANQTINTQSAGYQQRLQELREIKAFYGPKLRAYLDLRDQDMKRVWRQADPILRELLDLARRVNEFGGKGID